MMTPNEKTLTNLLKLTRDERDAAISHLDTAIILVDAANAILDAAKHQAIPETSHWWLILDSFDNCLADYSTSARRFLAEHSQ